MKTPKTNTVIAFIFVAIITYGAFYFLFNWVVADVFELRKITLLEAIGLKGFYDMFTYKKSNEKPNNK